MLDQLLRHLRFVCWLLAAIDRNNNLIPRRPSKQARVYGPLQGANYRVFVTVQPVYPDFEDYRPVDVLRAKSTRRRLAALLEREVEDLLVGYKVRVRVENVSDG
jgi:hypothetical protein